MLTKLAYNIILLFHEAEFEITDGYYFNEGRNNKNKDVIKNWHDLKLKLKKENDKSPAQVVIKLLMNSMYGKTVIKPVGTDTIIKSNRNDFEKCISLSYNYIDSVLEVNGRYHIKKLNQVCLILIMFIVGLKSYPCLNEL